MATALIQERGTVSGNQPRMRRLNEAAAQTFLQGTPLMLNPAGAVIAWNGTDMDHNVIGVSKEFGASLLLAGYPLNRPVPADTWPYDGGGYKFGSVPYQPQAINLLRPYFNDGKTGVVLAIQDTLFYGQVGPAQTVAATDVGKSYNLKKDTDGHWYVDKSDVEDVVQVVKLDPWDTIRGVLFVFRPEVTQLFA